MESPLQVTYLHFTHAPDLDTLVRASAATLEQHAGHWLTSCHVFVECAHEHHDETRRYHARIHMELPGGTLAVNHEHHARHVHEDPLVAVRDAFEAATRQLTDWKRRHEANAPIPRDDPR